MTGQEAIDEVMKRPRAAYVPFPGVHRIARPDWHQLTTPGLAEGGLNEVSLAVMDEDKADRIIDKTIRGYEDLGLRFRWTVGPQSRPLDLGNRLEARGLSAIPMAGMLASTSGVVASASSGIVAIEEVQVEVVGAETIDAFNEVMMRGWGMQSTLFCDYNSHVLREAHKTNPFFLARVKGVPVGVASYFAFSSSAFLVGAVVLPDHRKQGVYRALVRTRQEHAAKAGIQWVTTHAMAETSEPLLARLGFQRVCRFNSYVNR